MCNGQLIGGNASHVISEPFEAASAIIVCVCAALLLRALPFQGPAEIAKVEGRGNANRVQVQVEEENEVDQRLRHQPAASGRCNNGQKRWRCGGNETSRSPGV